MLVIPAVQLAQLVTHDHVLLVLLLKYSQAGDALQIQLAQLIIAWPAQVQYVPAVQLDIFCFLVNVLHAQLAVMPAVSMAIPFLTVN